MAETLGLLYDKLTIVKLKQYHAEDQQKLNNLAEQASQLRDEIDDFFLNAISGTIPLNKLTFSSNKVYKREGNEVADINGSIAELMYQLADVNCRLWHEVEKGYEIEKVPLNEKDTLIKNLAILNLERNKCIDAIDLKFFEFISSNKS